MNLGTIKKGQKVDSWGDPLELVAACQMKSSDYMTLVMEYKKTTSIIV